MIEPEPLQQVDRTWVYFRGRKLSYFAGCDYLRLSSHPDVVDALGEGLKRHGWSVAASRLTTGNHVLYQKLENNLARFFAAKAALIVPSGYLTNLAVAQALSGQCSHVLIDEAAHPSLWDAAKAFDCPVLSFLHRSTQELAQAVKRCGPGARLAVLTDGMFSRDGSVAPLKEYTALLPSDAILLIDDAHGAGVLGANGRGSLELTKARGKSVICTITLSKALGTFGGAILCSEAMRRRIVEKSHVFIGSTPLPLPVVCAALQSLKILQTDKSLRRRLVANLDYVRDGLEDRGLALARTPGPVIVTKPRSPVTAARIKQQLLKSGIYPPLISYGADRPSAYFRFVISSEHTRGQLSGLVDALGSIVELLKPLG